MKNEIITSKNNEIVKYITALTDKHARQQTGCFLLEGYRAVTEAITAKCAERLFVSQTFYGYEEFAALRKQCGRIPVTVLSDALFQKISDTKTPQGIAAACKITKYDLSKLLHSEKRILLLENVRDPGNMGTIIRTAAAAGYQGIIASGNCVDVYNQKVLRSTAGCIFKTKIVQCKSVELVSIADEAKHIGYKLFAAHPRGGKDLFKTDFTGKIALVIGNEANGLSTEMLHKCDTLVTIKMADGVESLNASVAAALMMYETIRNQ